MSLRNLLPLRFSRQHPAPPTGEQPRAGVEISAPKTRRRLFAKYVALFVVVVCVALLSNGTFDVFFYYQEHKASLIRIQREQAEAAAAKIGQFIKEIESQLGWRGHVYVVDAQGRLIAHPDISLVLRNTDMSKLAQVRAARAAASGGAGTGDNPAQTVQEAENIEGHKVLTAYAPVAPLGWLMFVQLPAAEAYAPRYTALKRLGFWLSGALCFAVLAGMFLAGRMVGPIQALQAGAPRPRTGGAFPRG